MTAVEEDTEETAEGTAVTVEAMLLAVGTAVEEEGMTVLRSAGPVAEEDIAWSSMVFPRAAAGR